MIVENNRKQPPISDLCNQTSGQIAGLDEVGRGPLAGPVVAAAVIFKLPTPLPSYIHEIKDSKKLTAAKREKLYDCLQNDCGQFCDIGVGSASVAEIDQYNILQASLLAMKRAFEKLTWTPDIALIDGSHVPNISCQTIPIIKGDQKSVTIAAASIIAKVTRDRYMNKLAQEFPQYGWSSNMGYGTRVHMQALNEYGATPHHRYSFAPVKATLKRA